MQTGLQFEIPVTPRGQMRARHTARKLKSGKVFSHTYKDEKQEFSEEVLFHYLERYVPLEPFEGPVTLLVKAYMPKPKKPKSSRPTTKPDLDNLIKQIKDCMTIMHFWHDDNQVVEYMPGTGKYYSDRPRWEVAIAKA